MRKEKPIKVNYKHIPDKEALEKGLKFLNEKMIEKKGKPKKLEIIIEPTNERVDFVDSVKEVLEYKKQKDENPNNK